MGKKQNKTKPNQKKKKRRADSVFGGIKLNGIQEACRNKKVKQMVIFVAQMKAYNEVRQRDNMHVQVKHKHTNYS